MTSPARTTTAAADGSGDPAVARWFLTKDERGNPATILDRHRSDAHTEANLVRPLIHGSDYFRRLCDVVSATGRGDRIWFTDWRGDADQRLQEDGTTVRDLMCAAAERGVELRALLWRSHSDKASFSAQQNQRLGAALNDVGAEALLDQRVRRGGSHHQKIVIVRHAHDPARDVAFVGGIDLSHGRRDDAAHEGDPQQQPMDDRYGARAPWHDAMVEIRGPAVCDLLRTFTERWDDPTPLDHDTPYRRLMQRAARMPRHPEPLPALFDEPPPAGRHAVQVLRTYARKRPPYPFAPEGERSIARGYQKAFGRARALVYVEDQYLWSELVARTIDEALRASPHLRFVAVVPRYPDDDGAVTGPPSRLGQLRALRLLQRTAPDRVGVYDISTDRDVPIYVHAKVCVVDDVWCTVGSDNFNRRSWTHDSEATVAILDAARDERAPADPGGQGDGARRFARDLRLALWSEHLAVPPDDPRLLDPVSAFELFRARADALDAWHRGGRRGERPPGRVRHHVPAPPSPAERLWAGAAYRLIHDPDGRPLRARLRNTF